MRREISFEDQEWFLHTHSGSFADAQFAELEQPCSPAEDAFLNIGTILLAIAPVVTVILFKVL